MRTFLLAIGVALLGAGLAGAETPAGKLVPAVLKGRDAKKQIAPLTATFGTMSLDEAYAVQAELDTELAKRYGARVGYKVAYASKAAQEQFGVGEPARGTFFAVQRVPSGSVLKAGHFAEILLETEVAFTLGRKIDRPLKDVAALKPFVASVHAAFDAGNFPYAAGDGPGPVVADMVAGGTGAHVFVLGPAVDPAKAELGGMTMTVSRNGEVIRESNSDEVLGNPWNSLLWLVNDVIKRGRVLEPGEVVLTGTAAKAYRAKGGEIRGTYRGEVAGLGTVRLKIR